MKINLRFYRSKIPARAGMVYRVGLSADLFERLQLEPGSEVTLSCGRRKAKVRVDPYDAQGRQNLFVLPLSLRRYFLIPPKAGWHLQKQDVRNLRLGPVSAIITGRSAASGKLFVDGFMSKIVLNAMRRGQLTFLVAARDINPYRDCIMGYLPIVQRGGKILWRRRLMPFPQVFFNRIPNRTMEKAAAPVLRSLRQAKDTELVNDGFFNKWQVYRLLKDQPTASQHLPPTIPFKRQKNVMRFVREFQRVYFKPIGGSKGNGIIYVKRSGGKYGITYLRYHRPVSVIVAGPEQLWRTLRQLTQGRLYIAQVAVPLARYKGRPFDIRVSMQKDAQGNWQVAGMAAKTAGLTRIATHLINGGHLVPIRSVLDYCFQERAGQLLQELIETMTRCSIEMERALGRPLVELGWDVAFDANGRCWILECNSRPGRVIFRLSSLREAEKNSIVELLDYFKNAAGFGDE